MNRSLGFLSFPHLPKKDRRPFDDHLVDELRQHDHDIIAQLNSQVQSVGETLASAAAIHLSNPTHHISGTQTIQEIVAPDGFSGPVWLVADGAFSLGATGNIALGVGPFTVGQVIELTFDPNTGKWYPAATGGVGPQGPQGPQGPAGSSGGVSTMQLVTLAPAASPYNATLSNLAWTFYMVSAGGSNFSFVLPAAAGTGEVAVIKKMDSGANTVAVTPHGTDTIDGVNAAVSIGLQYDALHIVDAVPGGWAIW